MERYAMVLYMRCYKFVTNRTNTLIYVEMTQCAGLGWSG